MRGTVAWEWRATRSLSDLRAWAAAKLFPVFERYGFRIMRRSDHLIIFERRRAAWWLVFISVVAFWLSPNLKQRISVSFTVISPSESCITVLGDIPAKMLRVLGEVPGSRRAPE